MKKRIRRIRAHFPWLLIPWLNKQRCAIALENNPNGEWLVQIGNGFNGAGKTLKVACLKAFYRADNEIEWL